jgi:hypothetical protein
MSTDLPPTSASPLPDATTPLPDDPVILRHMIRELLDVLRRTRHENEQLQHRLDLLLRRLYGPRTERFDPNQPLLIPDAFDDLSANASQGAPPAADPRPEEKAGARRSSVAMGGRHCPRISRVSRSSTSWPRPNAAAPSAARHDSRSAPRAASSSITSRRRCSSSRTGAVPTPAPIARGMSRPRRNPRNRSPRDCPGRGCWLM